MINLVVNREKKSIFALLQLKNKSLMFFVKFTYNRTYSNTKL